MVCEHVSNVKLFRSCVIQYKRYSCVMYFLWRFLVYYIWCMTVPIICFFQSLLLLSKPYFLVKSLVMRLTRMHTVPKSDYVCSCKPDQWCYTHTQNNDGIYTMCARVKSFFFFLNHCDATQAWMKNSSFPLFPFNQSEVWSYTTEALLYFMWQFSKLYRFTESPHRHSCKGQWWD